MTSLTGANPQPMRSPWSFMGSMGLHMMVLAWVALVPSIPPAHYQSLYDREIKPYEKHIVWYKLSERLPDIKPPEVKHEARPLRARAKFEQNIVAGARDADHPPQLILAPAPEIAPAKPLPLPNIVAVTPVHPPALPFSPPREPAPAPRRAPQLPDAPKVAIAMPEAKPLDVPQERLTKPFTPPKNPKLTVPMAAPLPAAPQLAAAGTDLSIPVTLPHQEPKFVAPAAPAHTAAAAPGIIAAPPPAVEVNGAMNTETSLVIAGLDPSKSVEVPAPPGSVKSSFSGGPKLKPDGGNGGGSRDGLEVPSLTVRGGAKATPVPVLLASMSPTSPESLAAAIRLSRGSAPAGAAPAAATHGAVRVSNAPDARLRGRQVYTMALQTPNLTSYSGSWLVWFASREADIVDATIDLKPPLPLHLVSARYVHSAEEERVEGKVRLWAVIEKDGHVGDISLVQHLDDRLDQSAEEALGKWQFQPAQRNGVPIAVDAVFEIPFLLPPKPAR